METESSHVSTKKPLYHSSRLVSSSFSLCFTCLPLPICVCDFDVKASRNCSFRSFTVLFFLFSVRVILFLGKGIWSWSGLSGSGVEPPLSSSWYYTVFLWAPLQAVQVSLLWWVVPIFHLLVSVSSFSLSPLLLPLSSSSVTPSSLLLYSFIRSAFHLARVMIESFTAFSCFRNHGIVALRITLTIVVTVCWLKLGVPFWSQSLSPSIDSHGYQSTGVVLRQKHGVQDLICAQDNGKQL